MFLIQPGAKPVNHHLVELLIMIDAARRASAGRITAVVPYFAYGRSDKKDQPRVPITARLFADLIQTAGADRMLTMDLHAGQIQGFFHIPTDELTGQMLLIDHFAEQDFNGVVVAPDLGSAKRARAAADRLHMPLAITEKRRSGNEDATEVMQLIGEVEGRDVLIIDDEVDTAGTVVQVAELLRREGAQRIYGAATPRGAVGSGAGAAGCEPDRSGGGDGHAAAEVERVGLRAGGGVGGAVAGRGDPSDSRGRFGGGAVPLGGTLAGWVAFLWHEGVLDCGRVVAGGVCCWLWG